MESIIRSVRKEDLASLEELYSQSIGHKEKMILNGNLRTYAMYNKDLLKVAICEGKLIGFIISYMSTPRKAKIYSIYVSPSYRNQGIGKSLLISLEKELLRKYKDLKYLSVRILEEFQFSSQFFHQLKFGTITKINNYYKKDLSFPFTINNSISVKKAQKKHLDGILAIETQCFAEFWQIDKRKFLDIIKGPKNVIFIALLEEKIVGYNYNTLSISGLDGNYVRIATAVDYRKKGIATTLTYHAFEWFKKKGVDQVLLSTYADSSQHNNMYTNWGFKKIDREEIMAKKYS